MSDKSKIVSLAFRKVFAERIKEILPELERMPMFRVTGSDCSCVEIEQNKNMLEELIQCSEEIHKWVREVPLTTTKALVILDETYNFQLSKTPVRGQQTAWARHEGDKSRIVWSYFLRLCCTDAAAIFAALPN